MANRTVSDLTHRTSRFLDEHPVVRWFVVPLLFMATVVLLLGIFLSITPFGIAQLVVGYLAVATLAVVVGLAVEKLLIAVLAR